MSGDQLKIYLTALLSQVTIGVIIPLLALITIVAMFWFLINRAQKDPEFDIAQMFTDEAGRVSLFRVLSAFAFGFHSWVLMVNQLQKPELNESMFMWYGFIWAGTPAVALIMSKWNGELPLVMSRKA